MFGLRRSPKPPVRLALPPARPKRGWPPLLGLIIAGAGWAAWNAALYRGRIETEARFVTPAPAGRVWALLEDVDRWPLWQPRIPEAGWLGRSRWEPGSRFRWTLGRSRMVSIVEAISPGTFLSWQSALWGHRDRFEWRISESGSGTTVEIRRTIDGWGVWLAAPWLQTRINAETRDLAAGLVAAAQRLDAEAAA